VAPTRSNPQINPENPQQEGKQGLETTQDLIDLSEPSPAAKPNAKSEESLQPQTSASKKEDDLMKGIPPSKLLHSTLSEEPSSSKLRRTDSETQEEDEFHDALT
jgi:oxysterol-binding protein-related protein 8